MSDIMRPIPFSQLMNWIIEEHKTQDAIFGVRKMVTTNQEGALPIFDERIETPFGPAAGSEDLSLPRTSWHPTWPAPASLSLRPFRLWTARSSPSV